MSGVDVEIRQWLTRYLAGEVSLQQFEDWLVPASWRVEQSGNRDAIDLAHEIELRLAEHSNGHLNENELRAQLLRIAENYMTQISFGANPAEMMSFTQAVVWDEVEVRFQPSDIKPLTVFGSQEVHQP